ncbi:hypothetical protein D3C86_2192220 [compost metagenome]
MVCDIADMHNPAAAFPMRCYITKCQLEVKIVLMISFSGDMGIRDDLKGDNWFIFR